MRSCLFARRPPFRRGAVTPLTALSLSLLVGVAALVIDAGTLMEARRHVQAAADAAALAGAGDLYTNYSANQGIDHGSALSSAKTTASANGYSDNNSIVSINTCGQMYQGGPNVGRSIPRGYIEVVIQYKAPHLFSGVFGSGYTLVYARAVARGRSTPINSTGLFALNLKLSGALNVSSTGGLTVNGDIQVNSSNSSAISGSSTSLVSATQIVLGSSTGTLLGSILSSLGGSSSVVNYPPVPDPLLALSPPVAPSSIQGTDLNISSGTVDLYPGYYDGGIQISGLGTQVTFHANSDKTPGIYYLNGLTGLQVSNGATIQTDSNESAGVLIYNNWTAATATINLNTSGAITLLPPSSGPYRGLNIFQKRGTPANPGPPLTFNAQGNATLTGTIYAAHAGVSLTSNNSSNVMGGQIVADTVSINGSANLSIGSSGQPTANMRLFGLVE